jgi:hypothetical protein
MKPMNIVGICRFGEAGLLSWLGKKKSYENTCWRHKSMVLTDGGLGTNSTSIHTYYHVVYIPTA